MNREEEDNTVPSSFNIARWSCKRGFCQHELCKGSSPHPPPPDRLVHHLLVCLALDGRSSSFNALIYQGEEEGCKARRRESKSNRPPLSSSCRKTPGETNPPRRRKYSNGEEGGGGRRRKSKALYIEQCAVQCSGTNQNQPLILSPSLLRSLGAFLPLHFLLRTNLPL